MNVVTAVTTAQGTIKLMTTQEQDQPTATSEPARALLLAWPGVAALALGRRFRAFLPRLGLRVDFAFVVAAGGFRAAARVIALLEKPKGATLAELMKATGWQAHSVRGFLSGTLRKKMGLRIESAKRGHGERAYSISRYNSMRISLALAMPELRQLVGSGERQRASPQSF
jgi:hypothetical protein